MFRNPTFRRLVPTLFLALFLFAATPVLADCYGECMARNDCAQQYPGSPEAQLICLAAWSAGCTWGCMW